METIFSWYSLIDKYLSEGRNNANHYFTTVLLYFALYLGSFYSYLLGGVWMMDELPSPADPYFRIFGGTISILLLCIVMESTIQYANIWRGFYRIAVVAVVMALMFALGYVLPVLGGIIMAGVVLLALYMLIMQIVDVCRGQG